MVRRPRNWEVMATNIYLLAPSGRLRKISCGCASGTREDGEKVERGERGGGAEEEGAQERVSDREEMRSVGGIIFLDFPVLRSGVPPSRPPARPPGSPRAPASQVTVPAAVSSHSFPPAADLYPGKTWESHCVCRCLGVCRCVSV